MRDEVGYLAHYMQKKAIAAHEEVGGEGTEWNILHMCSKYDAVLCAKMLLKAAYRLGNDEYSRAVNLQTSEGYTMLMIAVMREAQRVLELLLQLGGGDFTLSERNQLRPYDLALQYRN